MRRLILVFLIAVCLSCGCSQPGRIVPTLATIVAVLAAQEGGADIPQAVIDQVQAILAGDPDGLVPVDMTTLTDEDRIISPLTKKPCMFITKKGLTPLGVLVVKATMPRPAAAKPQEPTQ